MPVAGNQLAYLQVVFMETYGPPKTDIPIGVTFHSTEYEEVPHLIKIYVIHITVLKGVCDNLLIGEHVIHIDAFEYLRHHDLL